MYQIVKAPSPVLLTRAKKISKIDTTIKNLVSEMTETLENAKDPEGVGLAAPQVGKSLQLFIVKEANDSPVFVFINPHIEAFVDENDEDKKKTKKDKNNDVKLEGCLSLNDIWGVVKRHNQVTLSYTDLSGKRHKETFSGFFATILQHETDHLHGVLFPKRVLEQKGKLYKSKKNDDGETEFEEISL